MSKWRSRGVVSLEFTYIGFGANLGQPQEMLARVLQEMNGPFGKVRRISRLYRTTPWGNAPEPDYVNAVIELETSQSARNLFVILQELEQASGRKRPYTNAPRVCDLDLLLHRDEIIAQQDLTVPHPRLHWRRFVLAPLCDLIPEERHPLLGVSFRELLDSVADSGKVVPIISRETVNL
ncbi:MAG: 2-amino-4-hydroxy-6-hydroxymethyldihydropteridine diphosphokinase [bacterium]